MNTDTDPADTWTGHVLEATPTNDHTAEDPNYDHTVTCTRPDRCNGWTTCAKDHVFNNDDDGVEAQDTGEHEFHSVTHTYHSEWGWTVPYEGCVVGENIHWCSESADEIAYEHGPGRYRVESDWIDESSPWLVLVSRIEVES